MTLSYTTTEDDILALNRYYTQSFPPIRQRLMRLRIFYALLFGSSIVFFAYLFDKRHQILPAIIVLALICGVLLFIAFPFGQRFLARSTTYRAIRMGRYKGILGQQTLTVTPEALITQTEMGEGKYHWTAFVHTGQTATHLFLFVNTASALIIPKRAFSDDATYQSLLSRVITGS